MTSQQIAIALQPLLAMFTRMDAKDAESFVQLISKSLGWMKPERFQEVIRFTLDNFQPGSRLPSVAQLKKCYQDLAKTRGWNDDAEADSNKCKGCNGLSMVQTYLRHANGEVYSAMKACPLCRQTESPIRGDCVEITREEFDSVKSFDKKRREGWLKLFGFEWPEPLEINEGARLCAEYLKTDEGQLHLRRAGGKILQRPSYLANNAGAV